MDFGFGKRWGDREEGGNHAGRILTFRACCVEFPDVAEMLIDVSPTSVPEKNNYKGGFSCYNLAMYKHSSRIFRVRKKEWKPHLCCHLTVTVSSPTVSLGPRGRWGCGGTMPASPGVQGEAVGLAEVIWGWTRPLNWSTIFTFFLFAVSSVFIVITPNPGSSHLSVRRDSRLCEQERLCKRGRPPPACTAFKTNKSVITVSVIKMIWLVSC